ncbi:MAG: subclass B3 metallo-beta-lactamase [Terriglobia bacterium]
MKTKRHLIFAGVLVLLSGVLGFAQAQREVRDIPTKPFKIIGNIYYVGVTDPGGKGDQDAVAYLITTPQGHILLDTIYDRTVPQIVENIQKMGFRHQDVKIMINSHAHTDHMAGHPRMKELTSAQVVMSEKDAIVLADGGRSDFRSDGRELWKPMKADRIIKNGDTVSLGGVALKAHLTPGHTKGCTTWTMVAEEAGRKYNVVVACGVRAQENVPLIGNTKYPEIANDFAGSFATLKSLPADIFLGVHGSWFDLAGKAKRLEQAGGPNPFLNPGEYRDYIATFERQYMDQLLKERAKR